MKYIAALLGAILLAVIFLPVGFLYAMFFRGRTNFLYKTSIGIDQLGNVVCGKLFNLILTKKTGYPFGNEDEVISSVIGKNLATGTLTFAGRLLAFLLDEIQKGHVEKSIENFSEATNKTVS